jgi:hypothetical protein
LGTAPSPRAASGRLRAGGAARLGADLRVYISAPPAAPPQDPQEDRGAGVVCERAGGAARLGAGATRRHMQRHASRHRRPRDPQRDRAVTTRSGSGPESAVGWEELRDSERIYASTCVLSDGRAARGCRGAGGAALLGLVAT